MKKLYVTLLIILIFSRFSFANFFKLNNDSILKNSVGLNISFINTPQISYYLSSPISINATNNISPKIDLLFNRFLKKNFYLGINLSYTDLTFEGSDYHPVNPSNSLKSKLNYKIILGYLSLIKEFKIKEKFIISPVIEAGLGTNFRGFLLENVLANNDVIFSNTSILKQKNLIGSTALQINFVYKMQKSNRLYLGIGTNTFSLNYYDYLPIKNMFYYLNLGYKYAF